MRVTIITFLISVFCTVYVSAQWLQFHDSTASALLLVDFPTDDDREKDIATADFNRDGWSDIVVVRKQPFSNPGGENDLLLMNVNGVLTDQTSTFAPEFLTSPSDARDVFAGDLDGDDWPDLVLANTFEEQPVLYLNRGEDNLGNWLGFADSSSVRFPILSIMPLQFCAVWGGDITGNGSPDIYFSNYAPTGGCDDVLFINDGMGHFTDQSVSRLGDLRRSAFGTSVEIHDMDNDGDQDIVKISTLYSVAPWNDNGVFLLFNDGTGNFDNWVSVTTTTAAPYMFTVSDFTGDGVNDVYVVDDNQDYIRTGSAINVDTSITFSTMMMTNPHTTGFGGNCKLIDLDCDDDLDLGICDVDVDIPPCESGGGLRKFSMMELADTVLTSPYGAGDSIWNVSAFDFAFLDVDNNGTQDVFQGLCSGYKILLNSGLPEPCSSYPNSRMYVDSSATGISDGTSWTNAFRSLQQALLAAENCIGLDSILVAEGTYYTCGYENRHLSFNIPDGKTVLGGFPTGGSDLSLRNPEQNQTVLSGEIGEADTIADNSYHVVRVDSTVTCYLDGFSVKSGKADGIGAESMGAGLFCKGNISLKNVGFSSHSGAQDGYVVVNFGTVFFEDCILETNMDPTNVPILNWPGSTSQFKGLSIFKTGN